MKLKEQERVGKRRNEVGERRRKRRRWRKREKERKQRTRGRVK